MEGFRDGYRSLWRFSTGYRSLWRFAGSGGFMLDSERERRIRWLHVVVGKREMGMAAVGSDLSPVRRVREG
ncbi:hypothetical protein HAX54_010465, partial [Datura stramonium]|nr:hypothetical protein [Datura stramonium]